MKSKSILIIDHDPKNLKILENNFSEIYFQVDQATSDSEAFTKLKQHSYHVVLSEINGPNIDGYHLLEQMQRDSTLAHVPVIFLTTKSDSWNRVKSIKLGAKDFIIKPKHVKEIVARVKMVVDRLERRILDVSIDKKKFDGRIEDLSCRDLITLFSSDRCTGKLTLFNETGLTGQIYFRDGNIYNAIVASLKAEEAIYKMMNWSKGRFSMLFCDIDITDEMNVSNLGILLQGAKRMEQRDELLKELPSLEAIVVTTPNFKKIVEQKDLTPDLKTFLNMFDGEKTLGRIVDSCQEDELVILRRILKLYRLGFLHVLRDFAKESIIPSLAKQEISEPVSSRTCAREEQNISFPDFDHNIPAHFFNMDEDPVAHLTPFGDEEGFLKTTADDLGSEMPPLNDHDPFFDLRDTKNVPQPCVESAESIPAQKNTQEQKPSISTQLEPALPSIEVQIVPDPHPAPSVQKTEIKSTQPDKEPESTTASPAIMQPQTAIDVAQQQIKIKALFKKAKGSVLVLGNKRKEFINSISTHGAVESTLNEKLSDIYYGTAQFRGEHFLNLVSFSYDKEFTSIIDYFKPSLLGYVFIIEPDEKKFQYYQYLLKILGEKLSIPSMIIMMTGEENNSLDHFRAALALKQNMRLKFCSDLNSANVKKIIFTLFEQYLSKTKATDHK
jgi:DNA-binding response OmpR family regulator